MKASINDEFGFGGMLIIDVGDMRKAYQLMEYMQNNNIGYLQLAWVFTKHYSVLQEQVLLLKFLKMNRLQWGFQKAWFVCLLD